MAEYKREYPQFALCGLSCGLCPRYHTDGPSACPGCGGAQFLKKHPPCGIISCSAKHGGVEYCYLCEQYPCKRYEKTGEYDSFITYRTVLSDFERIKEQGLAPFQQELDEKIAILDYLLEHLNDGRKKTFYCTAVNLLSIEELREVLPVIKQEILPKDAPLKEKAADTKALLEQKAEKRNISLALRKKF